MISTYTVKFNKNLLSLLNKTSRLCYLTERSIILIRFSPDNFVCLVFIREGRGCCVTCSVRGALWVSMFLGFLFYLGHLLQFYREVCVGCYYCFVQCCRCDSRYKSLCLKIIADVNLLII